ncbi:MAG: hypothetical protein MK108_02035 [Mariniblastus sp.]|nr:hypothetical protein [Mariniblastus sp.]
MSYAIIGIAFLLLVFFAVVAARNTWHWVNSVFLILTFIVGVGALVSMSKVYKERTADMKAAERTKDQKEANQSAARLAVFGPDNIIYGPESLRGRTEELNLALAGRGRVWQHGQVEAKGNNRIFKFPAARPADQAVGAMQDILLHAFMDGPVTLPGGEVVDAPVRYIGTVSVANEAPASVELEPVFLADETEFTKPSATWTLFEKMPADRNDAFHRVEGMNIKDEAFDITDYRNRLMTNYMPAGLVGLAADSPGYEELIDSYAFDGLSRGQWENWIEANRDSRINPRFEPSPEEVFVEYKFNKKSNSAYQVDADGNLETDGLFTPLGHAVRIDLHVGGPGTITFEKDQTVLVDQLNADGYQRSDGTVVEPFAQREDVTRGNEFYVRQKRDYPYLLSDLKQQTDRFDEVSKQIKNNNQIKAEFNNDTEAQITERMTLIEGLEKDKGNLQNDLKVIMVSREKVEGEWTALEQRIATLKKQVAEQHAELQKAGKVTNTSTKN